MAQTTDKDLNKGNLSEKDTDFSRNPSRTGTGTTGTKHESDVSRRPSEDYQGSSGKITEDRSEDLESDVERERMSGSEEEQ